MFYRLTVLTVIRKWNFFYSLIAAKASFSFFKSGSHLSSHAVSSIVLSAAQVLTVVFGMGTGVSPERIATGILLHLATKQ